MNIQAMRRMAERPIVRLALIGLGTALFVIVALLVHGFSPSTQILGGSYDAPHPGPFVDWNIHYRNYWQASQVLRGEAPLFGSVLEFFPSGISVGNIPADLAMRFLGGLLCLVFSPATAFSLLGFLALWGNALGGYFLGFQLTKRHIPAVLLGVVLTLCGMVAWALGTGNPEYAFLGWMCLHLFFLHRLLESGGGRNAVLCAVFGALAGWSNLEIVVHLLFVDLFLLTFHWREIRNRWKPLVVSVAVGAALLAPVVVSHLFGIQEQEAALAAGLGDDRPAQGDGSMIVILENSRSFSQYLPWTPKDQWTADALIPYGVLLLGVLGFWLAARRSRVWTWMALVFFVLSLGPYLVLQIGGGGTNTVLLPFYFLHKYLPFYDQVRFPNRISAFTLLTLGAAAAIGLQQLVERLRGRVTRLIPVAILLLVTAEMLIAWPISWTDQHPRSAAMTALREAPERGAVVALPMDFGPLDSIHLRNQTVHGHPLMNGIFPHNLGKTNPVQALIGENPVLRQIWILQKPLLTEDIGPAEDFLPRIAEGAPELLDAATVEAARADLREIGFDFVLYHRLLPSLPGRDETLEEAGDLERFLDEALGPPIAQDEVSLLYGI